ncbi:ATM interactor-like isoform X5 [Vulpes vulpes]|uniref:ATM interactor-like isoform X5 n=1 Tax=Vulpes vulpes TaxID=9627 RepID=A0ABM4ZFA3_VULVU
MAASEAAAAGSAALASGAPTVPTAARGAAAAAAAAASGPWGPPGRLRGSRPRPAAARQQPAGPAPPARELIQPSVSELSRAVRTNILCTVRGCGKILPNSPALNMHLVKSHRLQKTGGLMYTNYRELLYKTLPLCKYFEDHFYVLDLLIISVISWIY